MSDDDLRSLEFAIASAPNAAPVVQGTSRLRKLRFALPGAGKRGGIRVCYVYFEAFGIVFLLTAFAKNEMSDLSSVERKEIAALIGRLETSLRNGGVQ